MVETAPAMLAFAPVPSQAETRWFSPYGCVHHGDRVEVFVGGALVASYEPSDRRMRNVMLCLLAEGSRVRKVRLARAFGVSRDTVRLVRQQAASEAMAGVCGRREVRSPSNLLAHLGQEEPTVAGALSFIELRNRVQFLGGFLLEGKPHQTWLSDRRIRASTSSPGISFDSPRSTAAIRLSISAFHSGLRIASPGSRLSPRASRRAARSSDGRANACSRIFRASEATS